MTYRGFNLCKLIQILTTSQVQGFFTWHIHGINLCKLPIIFGGLTGLSTEAMSLNILAPRQNAAGAKHYIWIYVYSVPPASPLKWPFQTNLAKKNHKKN